MSSELNSNMETYSVNANNQYRPRNTLSLADRVEVIREHDRHLATPSLQSLARKFDCSSKQIKNILINRESILESYRSDHPDAQKYLNINNRSPQKQRYEKITFLSKVMYEYLQRMLYFNQPIDDHKFRLKATQIKECIAIENFQPTHKWMEVFKMTYGISGFDLESLRQNIVITEPKRPDLTAIDMIQYVSCMEKESNQEANSKTMGKMYPKTVLNGKYKFTQNTSSLEPYIIYDNGDEEKDEELQKLNFDDASSRSPAQKYSSSSNASKCTVKRRASSPFPDIESVDDALKHIKVLEEYAMLRDNFRVIGLLTQLEKVFQKKDNDDEI